MEIWQELNFFNNDVSPKNEITCKVNPKSTKQEEKGSFGKWFKFIEANRPLIPKK